LRISNFGADRRLHWLEYNPVIFGFFHTMARHDAPAVMASLDRVFDGARSYYDVGAGTGAYASQAKRNGHRVLASEHSPLGRCWARLQGVECVALDLTRTPPAPTRDEHFDLAYCFEVAEHVPAPLGDRLVQHLASAAPRVVFTAAQPGQGGIGHINEQPRGYWIERFAREGLEYREDLASQLADEWQRAGLRSDWLPANVMIYERVDGVRAPD